MKVTDKNNEPQSNGRGGEKLTKSELVSIYGIANSSFHEYTKVIWQFPTVLLTINILAIRFTPDAQFNILFLLSLLNYLFLLSVFAKHSSHQSSLKVHLGKLESAIFANPMDENLAPKFGRSYFSAPKVVLAGLLIANTVFFLEVTGLLQCLLKVLAPFGL